jgi:hypothetical protein
MFQDIIDFVRSIDWSGYHISVFEVLLIVFALIKKFNIVSLLILSIVLGQGFIEVQQGTDFSGPISQMVPFIVYAVCSLVFFIYAMIKLFSHEE